MTIEQKAKAYDVAIKALRSLFAEQAIKHCDRVYIKDITNIFPEFKESEDERTWIINYLSNRILNSTIIAEKENLKKAISWLEAQGEQKPAWSEKDEDILNTIINHFKVDIECTDEDDVVRWLKSLRPQNTWKPSDEQMEALESATENCAYSEYQDCLRELIGQLKKLREE